MTSAPPSSALGQYLLAALLVLLIVTGVSVLVVWWAAQTEAEHRAEETARSFAGMVASPLRVAELEQGVDAPTRETLDRVVSEVTSGGEVYRVKIWTLDDATATVVYSDLTSLEGRTVPISADLRTAWETDEAVVIPVPDDPAHTSEFIDGGGAIEVYLPFEDADRSRAVAELYLLPELGERMRELLTHTLPVAIGAPLLLSVLTFPLVLRLAKRAAAAESQRRAIAEHALVVSEEERRRLARLLHDGPIQDLAAVGYRLELAAASSPAAGDRAAEDVREQVQRLRRLLDDLDPHDAPHDLPAAIRAVTADTRGDAPTVQVTGEHLANLPPGARALVLRCTIELLRNALRHSRGSVVLVTLESTDKGAAVEVRDDGEGFEPGQAPRPGHHGLGLVRAAIEDAGGTMTITSDPTGTAVRFSVPQASDLVAGRERVRGVDDLLSHRGDPRPPRHGGDDRLHVTHGRLLDEAPDEGRTDERLVHEARVQGQVPTAVQLRHPRACAGPAR